MDTDTLSKDAAASEIAKQAAATKEPSPEFSYSGRTVFDDLNSVFSTEKIVDAVTKETRMEPALVIVKAELVPLYQKLRFTNNVEPAPGVILAVKGPDGTDKLPIQVGFYAGGINLDFVNQDGSLNRVLSYGYNRRQERHLVKGRTGQRPTEYELAVADHLLQLSADILDTEDGYKFRSWLRTDQARDAAMSKRSVRPGFSKALAVTSDHYFGVRNSEDDQSYLQLIESRKMNREAGIPARNAGVPGGLPF